jgi:hypothetical protein
VPEAIACENALVQPCWSCTRIRSNGHDGTKRRMSSSMRTSCGALYGRPSASPTAHHRPRRQSQAALFRAVATVGRHGRAKETPTLITGCPHAVVAMSWSKALTHPAAHHSTATDEPAASAPPHPPPTGRRHDRPAASLCRRRRPPTVDLTEPFRRTIPAQTAPPISPLLTNRG